jgi:hypothetical protein
MPVGGGDKFIGCRELADHLDVPECPARGNPRRKTYVARPRAERAELATEEHGLTLLSSRTVELEYRERDVYHAMHSLSLREASDLRGAEGVQWS